MEMPFACVFFFFSSRRRHTRCGRDWSSDVCSSDLCGVVLRVRDGKLIARDHWFLENAEHETEGAILSTFLVRCYLPLEVRARTVLLPFAPLPEDLASLTQLAPAVDWHVPQRGTNAKLAQLAAQNARHLLAR